MLALGCIQALKCNSNDCPTGIATQVKYLYNGLSVSDKKVRVANFHQETIDSLGHMMAALGIKDPNKLKPEHIMRRISLTEVKLSLIHI